MNPPRQTTWAEREPDLGNREVEVLFAPADAAKLLGLIELARLAKEVGLKAELPSESAQVALRLAIYRAAH